MGAVSSYDIFEQPTPRQIEQYFQDRQSHPERYNYNPLQVGNKWFYSGWSAGPEGDVDIPYYLGRSVTADSLFENIMHYYVYRGEIWEDCWEYNSGDSVFVYQNTGSTQNPNFVHQLLYVFSPGTEFYPFWTWFPNEPVTCPDAGWIIVFGQTVNALMVNFGVNIYTLWAEGFGPVYSTFDFGEVYIAGAIIDGVTYGVVSNQDEYVPPVNSLALRCYPNPFKNTVNLSLLSKSGASAEVSIYNMKGQLVRYWRNVRSDDLNWEGSDLNGQKVSNGIYLVKAVSGSSSAVSKIVKLP